MQRIEFLGPKDNDWRRTQERLAAGGLAQEAADLRVDCHRPPLAGRILARSRVVKLGKRLSVTDPMVESEAGEMLASGRGAYLGA